MTDEPERVFDFYSRCEAGCTHDLARGVLIDELRRGDGPNEPMWIMEPMGLAAWVARLSNVGSA